MIKAMAAGLAACMAAGAAHSQDLFETERPYEDSFSGFVNISASGAYAVLSEDLFYGGLVQFPDTIQLHAPAAGALCVEVSSRDGQYSGYAHLKADRERWGVMEFEVSDAYQPEIALLGSQGLRVLAYTTDSCVDQAAQDEAVIVPVAGPDTPRDAGYVMVTHTSKRAASLHVYRDDPETPAASSTCVSVEGGVTYDRVCALPPIAFDGDAETWLAIRERTGHQRWRKVPLATF